MDNFNRNTITLNNIDAKILDTFYANSDDADGRILTAQLTDNGVIVDTTGYELVLAFRTEADTEGLVSFIEMDLTQGLYQVTYPTSMMVPGRVAAQIRIIDGESVSISRTFYIDVEKSVVDENVVVATNDFSALQTALTKVQNLEGNYAPRLNATETEIVNARGTYSNVKARLDNTDSQLAAIAINAKYMTGDNDTQKIQNAINTGLNVYIPYGWSATIDNYITVSTKGQKIYGLGSITQTTPKTCIFLVTADNVEIRDITFNGVDGDSSNLPISYASAVIAKQVSGVRVVNCKINACSKTYGAGIWFTSSSNCIAEKNIVKNCYIGINTDDYFSAGSYTNLVDKNTITGCVRGYVLDLQGTNYTVSKGDNVTSNIINSCTGDGIIIDYATQGFAVLNNIVFGNTGNGVSIVHGSAKGKINNNKICNNSLVGIVLNGVNSSVPNKITISDNDIHDNTQDGIQLYTVEHIKIVNNNINNNGRYGIVGIVNSYPRHVKIINNAITTNVQDGIYLIDCFDISIAFNSIYGNSSATSNTYSGITIARANLNPHNITISHNLFFYDTTGYVEKQKYAINITASYYVNISFIFNNYGTQATASVYDPVGGTTSFTGSEIRFMKSISLTPTTSASIINSSLFLDSANSNKLSYKDSSGTVHTITMS